MHIDSLNYFFQVAKSKNISLVAKNSHISQSALSQQIIKLENSLNVKLFNRNNKGVSLTPEGHILLKYSETILNSYEKMKEELIDSINHKELIYIESIESLTLTVLPIAISKLYKRYSNCKININVLNSLSNENLLDNICDILITYSKPKKNEGLINKLIAYDDIILVNSNKIPANNLTKDDLLNIPLIIISNTTNLRNYLLKELNWDMNTLGKVNLIYNTDSYISALNSISTTDAFTFIPRSVYNNYKDIFNIKIVDIEGFSLSLPVYISYKESFYKIHLDYIKALKNTIKDYLI